MSKEYVLKEVTLTGLVRWLNENKEKESKKPFTASDVQQYVNKTCRIPEYMGHNEIEKNPKEEFKAQTYNLLK